MNIEEKCKNCLYWVDFNLRVNARISGAYGNIDRGIIELRKCKFNSPPTVRSEQSVYTDEDYICSGFKKIADPKNGGIMTDLENDNDIKDFSEKKVICYDEMNKKIVVLLRMKEDAISLYSAQRIEDLEKEVNFRMNQVRMFNQTGNDFT